MPESQAISEFDDEERVELALKFVEDCMHSALCKVSLH